MWTPLKYGNKNTGATKNPSATQGWEWDQNSAGKRETEAWWEEEEWSNVTRSEKEREWNIASATIDANPVPSNPPQLPGPPSTCHKNRWSSAQLVVCSQPTQPYGNVTLLSSKRKKRKKKEKQLMAFQSLVLAQPLTPSISGRTLELIEQW